MTDSSDLNALAERCEKEAAGSRELDCLIGYAVDLRGDDKHLSFRKSFDICGLAETIKMAESHQNIWRTELPRYTTSLDAALTLVPEGMKIDLIRRDDCSGYACIWTPRGNRSNNAATPALALCAAALRALAATE